MSLSLSVSRSVCWSRYNNNEPNQYNQCRMRSVLIQRAPLLTFLDQGMTIHIQSFNLVILKLFKNLVKCEVTKRKSVRGKVNYTINIVTELIDIPLSFKKLATIATIAVILSNLRVILIPVCFPNFLE